MKRENIEITISPSGEIEIEAVGFRGSDCEQATAFLEEALGKAGIRKRKPEFYRRASQRVKQKVGS